MEEVPRQDEDAVLLDAWRVRDDAVALERLVEKYRAPLFSLIFRYVGDVHEAEDCFQETWARVLPRLDAARSGKLLGYLFTTAHHLLVDAARRRKRSPFVAVFRREGGDGGGERDGEGLHPGAIDRDTPADAAERADFRRALAEALEALPDAQRKVFLLHTEGELPFAEIARREGCPLGTVLSRMHYAVTRLRSALAPFHPKGAGK